MHMSYAINFHLIRKYNEWFKYGINKKKFCISIYGDLFLDWKWLLSCHYFIILSKLFSIKNITGVDLTSINTDIIALAVFELTLIINKEYSGSGENDKKDVIASLRETLPRFIGTVCVALSLEGLIIVIKYSQFDLAGNLYYPAAIIVSTALLLSALGLFVF